MVFVPQRIKILKFVAEQGVVTLDDVARHLGKFNQIFAVRSALYDCGLTHTKFGDVRQGIWFIQNPKLLRQIKHCYFPYIPSFEAGRPRLYLVDHALVLNRIRTTLEQTNRLIIDQWWSENYIRALPSLLGSEGIAKIPDAIFYRQRTDGSKQIFYLEYERTFKNIERYKEIFRFYANRRDVKNKNVIYLCQDTSLKVKLEELEARFAKIGELDGAGLYFQFIALDDFYKTYLTTNQHKEERNGQSQKFIQTTNASMLSVSGGTIAGL